MNHPDKPPKNLGSNLAPDRLTTIMSSPSYRVADQDTAFLVDDEATRGVRLQLEYLKPELGLRQHGIEHTIVVFGSAKILEPEKAERHLTIARAACASNPHDANLQRQLNIAERARDNARYYEIAREFGGIAGNASLTADAQERLVVMTGGGPGIMEAVNRGASDVGAPSVGLNVQLPNEQQPNPYITPELCFSFRYFALRKLHFLHRARALVAFPGGFGTLDELFETLTLIETKKIEKLPVVLVGRQHWQRVFDLDYLVDEGLLQESSRSLFWYCESAAEIWSTITDWHRTNEQSLAAKATKRNV